VASTDFRDSPKGLFASPPQCYMHRQASFIPAFFPEGTEVGEDVDFFYFPAYAEKDLGNAGSRRGTLGDHRTSPRPRMASSSSCRRRIAHEIWMGAAAAS
jgi:alpha-glucoside transport system substrate-binding protein